MTMYYYVASYRGNVMAMFPNRKDAEAYCEKMYYQLDEISVEDAVRFYFEEALR